MQTPRKTANRARRQLAKSQTERTRANGPRYTFAVCIKCHSEEAQHSDGLCDDCHADTTAE